MTRLNCASSTKIAGACSAVLYLSLAWQSRDYGDAGLLHAAIVYALCAVLAAGVVALLQRRLESGPIARPELQLMILWLVVGGVLFRVLGVMTFPILEDDFYRYLWDGRTFVETGSPFGVAPAQWFDDDSIDDRFAAILDAINYPGVATVYGPTLQLLYATGYLFAPGEVWPLQAFAALADIGVMLLLLKLCANYRDLLLGGCVLYAWSPMLIKEFATTAHPDITGVLFVVLALLCYCRERGFWLGVCLGLATGVKPFALLIAPFLLGFRWGAWLGLLGTTALLSAPFLLGTPLIGLPSQFAAIWAPEGLRAMGEQWLFNAPLYFLGVALCGGEGGAHAGDVVLLLKRVLPGSFVLLWVWQLKIWLQAERARNAVAISEQERLLDPQAFFQARLKRLGELPHGWLFGVFLLVIPVLNPWYLAWWLPFAVLRFTGRQWASPWVASVAVGLSYVSGINLDAADGWGLYQIPGWVLALEFGVIAVAVLWDLFPRRAQDFGAVSSSL